MARWELDDPLSTPRAFIMKLITAKNVSPELVKFLISTNDSELYWGQAQIIIPAGKPGKESLNKYATMARWEPDDYLSTPGAFVIKPIMAETRQSRICQIFEFNK